MAHVHARHAASRYETPRNSHNAHTQRSRHASRHGHRARRPLTVYLTLSSRSLSGWFQADCGCAGCKNHPHLDDCGASDSCDFFLLPGCRCCCCCSTFPFGFVVVALCIVLSLSLQSKLPTGFRNQSGTVGLGHVWGDTLLIANCAADSAAF